MSIAKISNINFANISKILSNDIEGLDSYAHYKLNDDATNTTVTDDGTGANNGVCSVNTNVLSAIGKINSCFDFSGQRIEIDDLWDDIVGDTKGSFSVWIKPDSLDDKTVFSFADSSAGDYFWVLLHSSFNKNVEVANMAGDPSPWRFQPTTTEVTVGNWFHIVLVHNGIEPKLYINSIEQTLNYDVDNDKTVWLDVGAEYNNGRIGITNYAGSGNILPFDGKIDDFRYYKNVALNLTQIQRIYNLGNGTESELIGVDKFLGITK